MAQAAPFGQSLLRALNGLNRRLEQVLETLREHGHAEPELRAIAGDLLDCAQDQHDILLAAILLNQIVGPYSVRHCLETAIVASMAAQQMDRPRAERLLIVAAALSMNVGMARHAELFQHKESALTPEERSEIRRHPASSVDLLRWAGVKDEQWLSMVQQHHERDDGSGYPSGCQGQDISQDARLISLADRYCAFISARNYRRSLLPPVALARLHEECTCAADRELAELMGALLGPYPPGTLVKLANGEAGVVTARVQGGPGVRVHVLRDAEGERLTTALVRDTANEGCSIDCALHEDEARLRFTMQQVWGDHAHL